MKIGYLIIAMLLSLGLVMADPTVNLDPEGVLANQSYHNSSTLTYGFNVIGNQSTWTCYLYGNENGTNGLGEWRLIFTESNVANNTNTDFTTRVGVADIPGIQYSWDVRCNATGAGISNDAWGASGSASARGDMNFSVDSTDPVVTINYPSSNGAWYKTDTNPRIGLTVVDTNADSCKLSSNLNGTANATGDYQKQFEISSYTNDTQFNFTKVNSSNAWADSNTREYIWTYSCNDSAGNTVTLGSNYTFYIDTVAPGVFIFNESAWKTSNGLFILNDSTVTDYTPQIGWNQSVDDNFSQYEITFYKDAYSPYNSSTDIRDTISSSSTLVTNISTLAADSSYQIMITASDLAGNLRNISVSGYKYTTDSTSRVLYAGWNLIMNLGNALNLSNLLSYSGASQVSYFNSSHEYQTQVSGGSNGAVEVPYGEPIFVYAASDGTFDDMILNTSAGDTVYNITANITTDISSNWSIACDRNTTETVTFQEMDYYLNGNTIDVLYNNVTWFSYYNNSASTGDKFIPFVNNWTINAGTPMSYGDCSWFYLESDEQPKGYLQIDWLSITG